MPEELFQSREITPRGAFTDGIEGPACDASGNLYAVNYARQGTIGRLTSAGEASVFVELPNGSIGNGIRFDRAGTMFIADYTKHNVLRVDMRSEVIDVYAHEPTLNQPNDLAIDNDDMLFASDPNWAEGWGQLWRIGPDRQFVSLERNMGTTNGVEVDMTRRLLYVNETKQLNLWVYDLQPGGNIANKRKLYQFPDFGLDGMRLDVAGNLYVARWGKGVIAMMSPQGEILREITLHGAKCTNVAFGGADGQTCYVTVADTGAVEAFRTELPGQSWQLQQDQARM